MFALIVNPDPGPFTTWVWLPVSTVVDIIMSYGVSTLKIKMQLVAIARSAENYIIYLFANL